MNKKQWKNRFKQVVIWHDEAVEDCMAMEKEYKYWMNRCQKTQKQAYKATVQLKQRNYKILALQQRVAELESAAQLGEHPPE